MSADFADDAAFRLAVGDLLKRLLRQIDDLDTDAVEARLTEGNLQLTFEEDGSVFVLSQQTPTHELWLSANRRAWHFQRVAGAWVERDSREPMAPLLSGLIAARAHTPVRLTL